MNINRAYIFIPQLSICLNIAFQCKSLPKFDPYLKRNLVILVFLSHFFLFILFNDARQNKTIPIAQYKDLEREQKKVFWHLIKKDDIHYTVWTIPLDQLYVNPLFFLWTKYTSNYIKGWTKQTWSKSSEKSKEEKISYS